MCVYTARERRGARGERGRERRERGGRERRRERRETGGERKEGEREEVQRELLNHIYLGYKSLCICMRVLCIRTQYTYGHYLL